MDPNVVSAYIQSGLGIPPVPKQFRKTAIAPFFMVLLIGVYPGAILGSYWLVLSLVMIVSSLAMAVSVFVLSKKELTLHNRLTMQAVSYSNWIIQIVLIQTLYYTTIYGVDLWMALMYLPPIVTPLLVGKRNVRRLQSGKTYPAPPKNGWVCGIVFGFSGILGVRLGKALLSSGTSSQVAVAIALVCFTLISCPMSLGLLSYQRIYLLKKYNVQQ